MESYANQRLSKEIPWFSTVWLPDVTGRAAVIDALPDDPFAAPPSAYSLNAGYEKMIEGYGGKGYLVRTPDELGTELKQALEEPMPSIIIVLIDQHARVKPQKFAWLTQ